MTGAFDNRKIKVIVTIGDTVRTFDGSFYIKATGVKYVNNNESRCDVTIINMSPNDRTEIVTKTSPFYRKDVEKTVIILAGRASKSLRKIYEGNIILSTISGPPDVAVTLSCMTGVYQNGFILARSAGATSRLSEIAKQVADSLNLKLNFEAADKTITNFNSAGGALKQIRRLGETSAVDTYINNGILVVKNFSTPLKNVRSLVNQNSGMVGRPELNEHGVQVRALIDNPVELGGQITVESSSNPAANGDYVVYELGFDITSRDNAYYWTIKSLRIE